MTAACDATLTSCLLIGQSRRWFPATDLHIKVWTSRASSGGSNWFTSSSSYQYWELMKDSCWGSVHVHQIRTFQFHTVNLSDLVIGLTPTLTGREGTENHDITSCLSSVPHASIPSVSESTANYHQSGSIKLQQCVRVCVSVAQHSPQPPHLGHDGVWTSLTNFLCHFTLLLSSGVT